MKHSAQSTEKASDVYVYLAASVAAVGGFIFGYDVSIIEGAIIFLKSQFVLTPRQVGFAIASAEIGMMIGPLIASFFSDWLGRKKVLLLAALLVGGSAIGTSLAKSMLEFNLFRIVTGFGIGLATLVSPMYIAEVSPARIRGRLVTLNQLAVVVGGCGSIIVSYYLSFDAAWRWMFGSAVFPCAIFAAALAFIPQSPRWLAQKGRNREAQDILARVNGYEAAARQIEVIRKSLEQKTSSFREIFQPEVRRPLLIALGLAFFQAANGAGTITWYAPIIFQNAGVKAASDAIFQALILSIWTLIITVLTILYVDRAGRRPLLLVGTLGIAIGQVALGLFFFYGLVGRTVLVPFFLVLGFYAMSLAPLTWLIMSEIFPIHIRAKAQGVATVCVWASTLIAAQVFAPMMSYFERVFGSTAGAFWTFGAISILAFLFSWQVVPETKGKSLEEIVTWWHRSSAHI